VRERFSSCIASYKHAFDSVNNDQTFLAYASVVWVSRRGSRCWRSTRTPDCSEVLEEQDSDDVALW